MTGMRNVVVGCLLLLTSGCTTSPSETERRESTARQEVLATNERLVAAASAGDVAALAPLLSADLVVSDPSNTIRDREGLITLFASRQVIYRSVETTIDHARELGELFVIMGRESTVVDSVPEGVRWRPGTTLHRRYTNVYRREGAVWRLIIKQSTIYSVEEPTASGTFSPPGGVRIPERVRTGGAAADNR